MTPSPEAAAVTQTSAAEEASGFDLEGASGTISEASNMRAVGLGFGGAPVEDGVNFHDEEELGGALGHHNEHMGMMEGNPNEDDVLKEQDRVLPIANVARIMKQAVPSSAKVAKEAKETVQDCVSEFIAFVTSE